VLKQAGVVHDIKSLKLLYPYRAFPYDMAYTVGIQLFKLIYCDLMLCTTLACFSTFFQATMVPTLVEIFVLVCVGISDL